MAKTSPTQRTLAYCRKRGWLPAVVEKWIPRARVRIDLFGGIDLVVLLPGQQGLLGIQATTDGNATARERKLSDLDAMVTWLQAGLSLEVWGWVKIGHRWSVSRRRASLEGTTICWETLED